MLCRRPRRREDSYLDPNVGAGVAKVTKVPLVQVPSPVPTEVTDSHHVPPQLAPSIRSKIGEFDRCTLSAQPRNLACLCTARQRDL